MDQYPTTGQRPLRDAAAVVNATRWALAIGMRLAGIAFEGRPHCGIGDARNAARLLAYTLGSLARHVQAGRS